MLAKPFGAVSSLIQSLIVEVILTVSWRERLGGDHRPPTDSAPRRRRALLSKSCAGDESESGGEADKRSSFEHWCFPLSVALSGPTERAWDGPFHCNAQGRPNIRWPGSGAAVGRGRCRLRHHSCEPAIGRYLRGRGPWPGPEATLSGELRRRRRKAVASSEELKRTLSVLAKPFRAVISLVLGLIGVIPRAIEGR
jgi:hypothetical protein